MARFASPQNKLFEFFSNHQPFTYKKGEIVIRVGENPSNVFFIEEGYIKVYSLTESGEENLHFIYKPFEIFPIVWMFSEKASQVFYETMCSAKLRKASKDAFLEFSKINSDVMFSLMEYTTDILHAFFERIHNLGLTNSYPRIITRLLLLAKRLGREVNGKIVFDVPMTQKDIANSINMTRETASKELNKLARKRILKCSDRSSLEIYNLAKLEKQLALHYAEKSS
ncbi:MAG: Crp/Fnr family transcriptional regulator [Candidatus Daviesbacteria bacterium]|nr:Crp/Fnr family transcriptional regulator [Candidatus Daviesbacteria bacterium]